MLNCWLCGVGVTKENTAGKKKDGIANTCKNCNSVYVLVQTLRKLTREELRVKTNKLKQRLVTHEVVWSDKNLKAGELTKMALRRMPR